MNDTIELTIAPKDPQTSSELAAYFKGYKNGAEMAINIMNEMAGKKYRKPLGKRRSLK
jgi:hypothetical protein